MAKSQTLLQGGFIAACGIHVIEAYFAYGIAKSLGLNTAAKWALSTSLV